MPYGLGQVGGGRGELGWGDGDHARISLIISQPSLRRKQIKYTTEGILPFNTDPGINRAAPLESWFPPPPPAILVPRPLGLARCIWGGKEGDSIQSWAEAAGVHSSVQGSPTSLRSLTSVPSLRTQLKRGSEQRDPGLGSGDIQCLTMGKVAPKVSGALRGWEAGVGGGIHQLWVRRGGRGGR